MPNLEARHQISDMLCLLSMLCSINVISKQLWKFITSMVQNWLINEQCEFDLSADWKTNR